MLRKEHIFVILVIIISFITVPVFAAEQDSKLKFERSHASIYYGDKITFSGSLKDGLGYALAFESINILEDDGSNGSEWIASTTTDARGNYKVSVTAGYWDGKGNPVEVYAVYSGNGFNKSVSTKTYTVNVDPRPGSSYTESQKSDRTIVSYRTSILTIDLMKGSQLETFRVYPKLTDPNGNEISYSGISVYVDNQYKGTVSANMWSHSISCNLGNNFISISSSEFQIGANTYSSRSDSESFYCEPKVTESKSTTTKSTTQKSVEKNVPSQYITNTINSRNYFENQLNLLKEGITTAEKSLSGLQYESEDAQKKIDEAWSVRWNSLVSHNKSTEQFRLADRYLDNDEFISAYNSFEGLGSKVKSITDDLIWISKAIEDAKNLEEVYQKDKFRFCFLWWC